MSSKPRLRDYLKVLRQLRALGEHNHVLEKIEALSREFPNSNALIFEKTHALLKLKQFADAEAFLRPITQREPGNWLASHLLGLTLEATNNQTEALMFYRLSQAANPDYLENHELIKERESQSDQALENDPPVVTPPQSSRARSKLELRGNQDLEEYTAAVEEKARIDAMAELKAKLHALESPEARQALQRIDDANVRRGVQLISVQRRTLLQMFRGIVRSLLLISVPIIYVYAVLFAISGLESRSASEREISQVVLFAAAAIAFGVIVWGVRRLFAPKKGL